jgi:hypothetical protein
MPDYAAPFRSIADKIELNAENDFGGAFVIMAPGADPQELLLLDNSQNPAIFWSLVQTRAQIALAQIEDAERKGNQLAYARR